MMYATQVRRLFVLAFFAYVILDLGCPFVPGAFSFDPDQSVDAVSAWRARPSTLTRVVAAPSAMTSDPVRAGTAGHAVAGPVAPPPVVWRPQAGPDDLRISDARPSVDDD